VRGAGLALKGEPFLMRAHFVRLAILLLLPTAASAQTAADGVKALVRGDYATAVRILRPLAEDSERPDPLVLFFMATLYQSGHGVARDEMRACGMYLKAAASPNPLAAQSTALARAIHMDHPVMHEQCVAMSIGVWRVPAPAFFTLARDHWVRIDRSGFVVGYQGTEHTASLMGGVGWVFLPTRYTALDVAVPAAGRRHFCEFFIWMPDRHEDPHTWSLWWSVYEVVGAQTFSARTDTIATITGARPPSSFAIDDLAHLGVNPAGEAEWVVLGAWPRSGIIPIPEQR
jgi:hypothetical protein